MRAQAARALAVAALGPPAEEPEHARLARPVDVGIEQPDPRAPPAPARAPGSRRRWTCRRRPCRGHGDEIADAWQRLQACWTACATIGARRSRNPTALGAEQPHSARAAPPRWRGRCADREAARRSDREPATARATSTPSRPSRARAPVSGTMNRRDARLSCGLIDSGHEASADRDEGRIVTKGRLQPGPVTELLSKPQTCDLRYIFTKTVWHNWSRSEAIMFDPGQPRDRRDDNVLGHVLHTEGRAPGASLPDDEFSNSLQADRLISQIREEARPDLPETPRRPSRSSAGSATALCPRSCSARPPPTSAKRSNMSSC